MYKIRKTEFIGFKQGVTPAVNLVRVQIDCDTASDIPAYDAISGSELIIGSLAWDISTGDIYGLNSSHEWIKQGEAEEGGGE